MVGSRVNTSISKSQNASAGQVVLRVDHVTVKRGRRTSIEGMSFELRSGEILGIAGVLGSGRTTLLNAIYGNIPYRGRLFIAGKEYLGTSIRRARSSGIALLTEDRKRDGLLFNLSCGSNITIGRLGAFSMCGVVSRKKERQTIREQMSALHVKAASPDAAVVHLSGGNQQKLLLGRALLCSPRILLLDEPTKGVDVATRLEIYRLIVGLAADGMGVIVVSSDPEEIIRLADRCLVMAEGRIIDEIPGDECSEARVLQTIAKDQIRKSVARQSGPQA
jgi:ABC-type sugar transport system ATPase subunit